MKIQSRFIPAVAAFFLAAAPQMAQAADDIRNAEIHYGTGRDRSGTLYKSVYGIEDCFKTAIIATQNDVDGAATVTVCKGATTAAIIICTPKDKWGDVPGCTPLPASLFDDHSFLTQLRY